MGFIGCQMATDCLNKNCVVSRNANTCNREIKMIHDSHSSNCRDLVPLLVPVQSAGGSEWSVCKASYMLPASNLDQSCPNSTEPVENMHL